MKNINIFKTFLIIIISILSKQTYSQIGSTEKKIAYSISLMKSQLKNMKDKHSFSEDSLRIEVMNRISALYTERSEDSALLYANLALTDANKLKQNDLIAVSYHNIGNTYNFYKDSINAEKNLLEWYNIRKEQGGDKFRWALKGMREFYSKYKQIDKLEKIEEEWMAVLDEQYDKKHISPWMPKYDQIVVEDYRLSMYPVFNNLIELQEYNIAEKLFTHMAEKCPDCCKWLDGDMPFYSIESILLSKTDTAGLSICYYNWFNVLDKYCADKTITLQTFKSISDKYIGWYKSNDTIAEKYYQKILSFTYKIGGDSAAYDLMTNSLNKYSVTEYERFKLNLFALKICIKTNDSLNIEKHYSALDSNISNYSSVDKDDRYKILNLISNTEKSSSDERLKKWCSEALKKIR
jgi:hypothetical protein